MKFVIDMMGGDSGIEATIGATKEFIKRHPNVELFLIGDLNALETFKDHNNIHLVESKTVLKMDVDPLTALKEKDSSLMVAIETYLANNCDCLISAGSTGALLSAAIFKIKRIPGITRPCLITSFPTIKKNKKFVVCDLGETIEIFLPIIRFKIVDFPTIKENKKFFVCDLEANNSNTKEELLQFAKMGSIYYSIVYQEENPKVYLLSNGTEEEKGSPVSKEAYPLLKDCKSINFKGNIEARDPLYGDIDVLVSDGYTGNIFLKSVEGTAKVMSKMIKDAFKKNVLTMIGYLFSKKGINEIKKKMDYKNVGGALLMGVNGVVIKAHGSSDVRSFLSALENGYKLVEVDIVNKFKKELA